MTGLFTTTKLVKRNRAKFIGVLVVLLLVVALSLIYYYHTQGDSMVRLYYSITQRIDIGDGGVISGVPCSAPCAFGVRAGETSFDQVLPLLGKYGVSKCDTEPNVSWVAIHCGFGRFNVQASTQTNLVNAIWFTPNDSIPLGEVIEKYGAPDFVALDYKGFLEKPTIKMYLYWDSLRMSITLPEINAKSYSIKKGTKIEGVDFSDEELFHSSSEVGFGWFYKHWNGYDIYQP